MIHQLNRFYRYSNAQTATDFANIFSGGGTSLSVKIGSLVAVAGLDAMAGNNERRQRTFTFTPGVGIGGGIPGRLEFEVHVAQSNTAVWQIVAPRH